MQDYRGHFVSGADTETVAQYEAALKSFQTFFGDAIGQLDQCLERSPGFVMGHVLRAIAYYLTSERRFSIPARDSLESAGTCPANEREAMHVAAVSHLLQGRWFDACRAFDEVLVTYPHDILALQAAHLTDFFLGDAVNLRNRPARVLPVWDAGMPGASYVKGMYAFGLEECNQYALAERYGCEALAADPRDPWSVHAVVHVYEMQGRCAEGVTFMHTREADWSPDNGFAYHNWWHCALLHLELGDLDGALRIADDHVLTDANESIVLLDMTALLWRLTLAGASVGNRWQGVADRWAARVDSEQGFYAFNDFHAALAFAGAGRMDMLEALGTALSHPDILDVPQDNLPMLTGVGAPLVQGTLAFARGDHREAAALFNATRDQASRFGGSHAQRDIINLTLLASARRGGDDALLAHLLRERTMAKPSGRLGELVAAAA